MPPISLGTVTRLVGGGLAAYLGAEAFNDPNVGAAIGNVLTGYLTNRANAVEEADLAGLLESKNRHLQLLLAGAMRLALDDLRDPQHDAIFASWEALLEDALDDPHETLPAVLPAQMDGLLDAANPHLDRGAAYAEAERLLRFWLAYRRFYEANRRYPTTPPADLPDLPAELGASLEQRLLPAFERACANLLNQNDHTYARRAAFRRRLDRIDATTRDTNSRVRDLHAASALRLARLQPPQPYDASRELEILRAENRAIPVVGRRADLDSLHEWLRTPETVSCRIVTGPAGTGKTRLAYQFLEEIDGERWDAGFLRGVALDDLPSRHWTQPTVAIVDYAATAVHQLKPWLEHLADNPPDQPLRLLLLEREASEESGWLRVLIDKTSTGARIANLFHSREPHRVASIDDAELRRAILTSTLERVDSVLRIPPPGQDTLFDQRLAEPRWRDPLYLMMAALVARQPGGLVEALALSRTDLAFRVADRELDRIRRFMPHGTPPEASELLTRLAGVITACQSLGISQADLTHIAREEAHVLGIHFPGGPSVAASRVAQALTRRLDQGMAGQSATAQNSSTSQMAAPHAVPDALMTAPIEPDMVGEAVLVRTFSGQEGTSSLLRAARRWDRRYAPKVCASVARACQDFASEQCQAPLDWIEAIISESHDLGLLFDLEKVMPHETTILRERAAGIDELLLNRLENLRSQRPSDQLEVTIGWVRNNYSNRLADLGRFEEAQTHARQAVETYRQLERRHPGSFRPELAMSLHNLAGVLYESAQPDQALEHAQEAMRIYRELFANRPDEFRPKLAGAANNLVRVLVSLRRFHEAVEASRESITEYERLAETDRDTFLPALATSLSNSSNALSGAESLEEALSHAQDSVRFFKLVVAERRDAYLPHLAFSLNVLAERLIDLDRQEDALPHAEQSAAFFRSLANQTPGGFLDKLAMSTSLLARLRAVMDRSDEAIELYQETIDILRSLPEGRRQSLRPELAASLGGRTALLRSQSRHAEALLDAEEAVQILSSLARHRPDVFLEALELSLAAFVDSLDNLGRVEEARPQVEEAMGIYRVLAQDRPDAFNPELARTLGLMGYITRRRDTNAALPFFEEAIDLLLPFFVGSPFEHRTVMDGLCSDYVQACQAAAVRPNEALLVQVIEVLRTLDPGSGSSEV